MAQITFISVGTLKEGYLVEALAEYKKRLLQFAKVDEINIKEERIQNESSKSQVNSALCSEGKRILASIPKGSYVIALCIEGREFSSEDLAGLIGSAIDEKGKICFIIGSSHGLSSEVKDCADLKLSFSKLTFPHQLMRVILFESVYRSFTIIANKSYHK